MQTPEQKIHDAIFGNNKSEEDEEIPTPTVLENIDWSSVIAQAIEIRDEVINEEYHEDNDNAQYLYEGVMTAVFGEDFFKWFNKNT